MNARPIIAYSICGLTLCAAALSQTAHAQVLSPPVIPVAPDDPLVLDPVLDPVDHPMTFDPRLKALWLQALARPDAETRTRAAEAFARAADLGMTGLTDIVPTLTAQLQQPDQTPEVRLALLHALIAMKTRALAPLFLAHGKTDGLTALLLTDQALADLNDPAARGADAPGGKLASPIWRARLTDATASPQARASAVRCLAAVRDTDAAPALLTISQDSQRDPALRLAAAQAVLSIQCPGLDEAAAALLTRPKPIDHLIAVTLIARTRGTSARASLSQLAADDDAVVVARAVAALVALDPNSLAPIQANLLRHADPDVRRNTVQGLAGQKTATAVTLLGALLSDPSVKVRAAAADALITLDHEPALRPQVRTLARGALADNNSHTVEQAANVLGAVHETAAADALLALLDSPHPTVRLAGLVALRRLAVPQTCPALLAYAQKLAADWTALPSADPQTSARRNELQMEPQFIEIFQAFGLLRYQPAEALLLKFVPKQRPGFGDDSRTAAIWALGKLFAPPAASAPQPGGGDPLTTPAKLVSDLIARLKDDTPMDPETATVRAASASALGHMKSSTSVGSLRSVLSAPSPIENLQRAARWAIQQITAQTQPPIVPMPTRPPDSFLEPLNKD